MNVIHNDIKLLKAEIDKGLIALSKIEKFYYDFRKNINDKFDIRNAITLSEIYVNYYTCLETIFFRIASFFENNLQKDRWHAELLKRMTLKIDGIREQVISEDLYEILDEFRRFRHFKRYYFDFSYDWDKLEFLQKKFEILINGIKDKFDFFINFLNKLSEV